MSFVKDPMKRFMTEIVCLIHETNKMTKLLKRLLTSFCS